MKFQTSELEKFVLIPNMFTFVQQKPEPHKDLSRRSSAFGLIHPGWTAAWKSVLSPHGWQRTKEG